MYIHPYTKEPIEFKSKEELIDFLSRLNPSLMRDFKKQYYEKNPLYEILDYGLKVETRKKKCIK